MGLAFQHELPHSSVNVLAGLLVNRAHIRSGVSSYGAAVQRLLCRCGSVTAFITLRSAACGFAFRPLIVKSYANTIYPKIIPKSSSIF